MTIKLDSKKVVFFLLAYYLCLQPMGYIISNYYLQGTILGLDSFPLYNAIYTEQIVLLLTLFFLATKTINISSYLNFNSKLTFLLFILVFLIVNLSYFDVGKIAFGQYYSFSTFVIAKGFVFVLLGLNIHVIDDVFRVKKMRIFFYGITACYVSLILISAIISPESGLYSWYLGGIWNNVQVKELGFDYLYISDTVALILLLIMSQVKSMVRKMLILFLGLFIIILSGSRTSFLCFGLSGIIFWVMMIFWVSKKKMLLPVALIILLILLVFIYWASFYNQVLLEYGDKYRFAFVNYKTDGSYLLRTEIFYKRWRELEDIWFVGRYMSELAEGRPGTYFHNWLSFWSAFGIVPFLLFIILIVSSLNRSARQFFKDSGSPRNQLLFLWSIFIVSAIIVGRAYDFYYFWFVLFGSSMINRKVSRRGGRRPFTSQIEKKLRLELPE